MREKKYTDKQIIEGIRTRDPDIIKYIYLSYKPEIRKILPNKSIDHDKVDEVFQVVVLKLIEEIKNGKIKIKKSFKNYFIVSCKNVWIYEERMRREFPGLPDENMIQERPSQYLAEQSRRVIEQKKAYIIEKCIKKLEPGCRDVINLYSQGFSMAEIAAEMGYSNAQVARNKKCKCLGYLRKLIKKEKGFEAYF